MKWFYITSKVKTQIPSVSYRDLKNQIEINAPRRPLL